MGISPWHAGTQHMVWPSTHAPKQLDGTAWGFLLTEAASLQRENTKGLHSLELSCELTAQAAGAVTQQQREAYQANIFSHPCSDC